MRTGIAVQSVGRPGRRFLSPRHLRIRAVEKLHSPFSTEGLPPEVSSAVESLHNPDPLARLAAVWELGQLGAIEALPALLILFYDGEEYVRQAVQTVLLSFGMDAQPWLEEILTESENPSLLWAAMKALLLITA